MSRSRRSIVAFATVGLLGCAAASPANAGSGQLGNVVDVGGNGLVALARSPDPATADPGGARIATLDRRGHAGLQLLSGTASEFGPPGLAGGAFGGFAAWFTLPTADREGQILSGPIEPDGALGPYVPRAAQTPAGPVRVGAAPGGGHALAWRVAGPSPGVVVLPVAPDGTSATPVDPGGTARAGPVALPGPGRAAWAIWLEGMRSGATRLRGALVEGVTARLAFDGRRARRLLDAAADGSGGLYALTSSFLPSKRLHALRITHVSAIGAQRSAKLGRSRSGSGALTIAFGKAWVAYEAVSNGSSDLYLRSFSPRGRLSGPQDLTGSRRRAARVDDLEWKPGGRRLYLLFARTDWSILLTSFKPGEPPARPLDATDRGGISNPTQNAQGRMAVDASGSVFVAWRALTHRIRTPGQARPALEPCYSVFARVVSGRRRTAPIDVARCVRPAPD